MRASEAYRRYNDETDRLIGMLLQKERELAERVAAEPGGAAAIKDRSVLVHSNEDLRSAAAAVLAARKALGEHSQQSTHFVRNYKILDLESGEELDSFTVDHELAPWNASKRMKEKQISRYDLQEQLPDGTWVPYFPPSAEP
ncbi:hypothetical protein [Arthrobacter sp. B6]|uniref:hypothetical protein n=1 Tax=Arthrobacter sp. B6 TaxID=1570137 RepID=UPI0012E7F273|nr:hypothetical protein [Arthrobacter sp. B6]